jgi:hypothetical protein
VWYGRIIGAVLVAIMCGGVVVGCSGEDDASADVTKAQFTEEADAVCAERKKDWDAMAAAFTRKTEAEEGVSFKEASERTDAFVSESIVPLLEDELASLEELDVPEGDEAKVDKMLQNRSRAIQKIKDEGSEVLLGNPFKTFEKEAKAYGLNCSIV